MRRGTSGRPSRPGGPGRPFLLLLAVSSVLCGCLPRYGVSTFRDDFAGVTVQRMRGNVLEDPDRGGEWIELNAEVSRRRTSTPDLSLVLLYRDTRRWLRIPYGESLQLLADRELIALHGSGSLRSRRRSARGVEERVVYAVTAAQLRRIAGAGSVRLRILGRRDYVERRFSREGLARLRAFVSTHVDAAGTPDPRAAPASRE